MKKIFICFSFALMLAAGAFAQGNSNQQNGNSNCMSEGQAIAIAVSACDLPPNGQGRVYFGVQTGSGLCIEGGCFAQWEIWYFNSCNPHLLPVCLSLPAQQVALVNRNCDGTTEVQCMSMP